MFSLPFKYQPQSVFKPDDFSREPPPVTTTQGLGTLQYNTRRGIFRPGGYGGGIFDGDISGLGYTADSLPWSTYSADTAEFQKDLNALLRAEGKPTLTEDGRLGKDTCNACRGIEACRPVPTNCAQQYATPAPSPVVAPPLTVNQSAMLPSPGMSSTTKNALIFVGAGAAAIGIAYFVMKRKKAA